MSPSSRLIRSRPPSATMSAQRRSGGGSMPAGRTEGDRLTPKPFLCEPQPLQKEAGLETPGCARVLWRGFGTGAPDGGTRWSSVRIGAAMDAVTSLPPLTPDPQTACLRADPMIKRRTFLGTLGLCVLAASYAAEAQPGRVFRIGILGNFPVTDPEGARLWGAFIEGLRDLGYAEGRNITIEHRSSEGKFER